MRVPFLCLSLLAAAPALAEGCPPVQVDADRVKLLMEAIRFAPTEMQSREITADLWKIWATAPDEAAQKLLDQGMSRRAIGDYDGALTAFDDLIAYCPDYAEGYNQRAFALYLRQDFAEALVAVDAAITRSPQHLGALSGRALILLGLGRVAEAQTQLQEALTLNPWLPERHLLTDPPGREL